MSPCQVTRPARWEHLPGGARQVVTTYGLAEERRALFCFGRREHGEFASSERSKLDSRRHNDGCPFRITSKHTNKFDRISLKIHKRGNRRRTCSRPRGTTMDWSWFSTICEGLQLVELDPSVHNPQSHRLHLETSTAELQERILPGTQPQVHQLCHQ